MVGVPDDVLNDVFSRFILPEAKNYNNDTIRLCFAIEMAHWFYLDYIRPVIPNLPDSTVEQFARTCFKYMPSLLKPHQEANVILKQWRDFKRRVPVYGAMLINTDKTKALMVEGNSTRGCWTFPRGKIEENEDPFDCACREVKEETSFDIRAYADRNIFIEKVCSDRRVRLYVVHCVPENTLFYTQVRGEISNYQWFVIDELPGGPAYSHKKKKEQFFMVNQFVREYNKSYRLGKQRNVSEGDKRRSRGASFTDSGVVKKDQQGSRKDSYRDNERDNPQHRNSHRDNERDNRRDNERDNRRDTHEDVPASLAASTTRSMSSSLAGNYPLHHPNYMPQQYKVGKSSSAQQRNYGTHTLPGGAHPAAQEAPEKRPKKGFMSTRGGRGRRFNPPRMARKAHQTLASFELDIKSLMLCVPEQVSVK